jgi:multimeric flavodoxin WrbA
MAMKVLFLNCTMRKSPMVSNTRALVDKAVAISKETGVKIEVLRVLDHKVTFGISSDEGEGDEWAFILEKIKSCDILFIATTIWLGVLYSVAKILMREWMGLTLRGMVNNLASQQSFQKKTLLLPNEESSLRRQRGKHLKLTQFKIRCIKSAVLNPLY